MIAPITISRDVELEQRQLKAELILRAVSQIGIDAMTIGKAELVFGRDFLLQQAATLNLPIVCANLEQESNHSLVFPAYVTKTFPGGTLGVLGLTQRTLVGEGWVATDPIIAAQKAVQELKQRGATVIVALSNQSREENDLLARQVDGIDVIVAGSTHQKHDAPQKIANSLLVEAGNRSKYLGVLDLSLIEGANGWSSYGTDQQRQDKADNYGRRLNVLMERLNHTADSEEKERLQKQISFYEGEMQSAQAEPLTRELRNIFTHQHMPLSKQIKDDPVIQGMVDETLQKMSSAVPGGTVQAQQAANEAEHDHEHPNKFGSYMGAELCKSCHQTEYAQWKSTPHARAYTSLEKDNRQFDFQCYGCHITGHGSPGGPSDPKVVGHLRNVQCESCHLAGRQHVENPTQNKPPAKVPEELCLSCHTPEQTEGRFVYSTYLPKVVHNSKSPNQAASSPH